jgi:hypothetical protein
MEDGDASLGRSQHEGMIYLQSPGGYKAIRNVIRVPNLRTGLYSLAARSIPVESGLRGALFLL